MEKKIRKLTFEEAELEYRNYFLSMDYEKRIEALRAINLGENFNKPPLSRKVIYNDFNFLRIIRIFLTY